MKKATMRNCSAGVHGRLRLFYFWLVRKDVRKRVSIVELARNCITPRCENIARRFSENKYEDNQYVYYSIRGFNNLFSYPKELPYHNFAQVISEGFLKYHWHYYEIPQTKIEEGDVVVDCGSAEGFFVFKHAAHCKHIYCIEPLPVFTRALHKLYGNLKNVTVIQAALSDKVSHLYLSPSSISSTCRLVPSDEKDIQVKAVTLDSLFAERLIKIDYLKADLEGFEEMMIAGGLETIKMSKPKIAITTYHMGQDYQALIGLVRNVVPEYKYLVKGIEEVAGNPVMLHMWC
jgi:FkbM family methyltransferase